MPLSSESRPSSWDSLPAGETIKRELESKLAYWWPRVFGYHLLRLGALSRELEIKNCPVGHQFSLYPGKGASIVADFASLPLAPASIDAVVMNLVLEFEANPYRILREADRVLVSGGYLFIVGINPFSCAFFGKLLPRFQQALPWSGHFFMPARVKDWLGLLGYQLVHDERLLYHSLLSEAAPLRIWHHWQQKWLPGTGSLYLLVARKLDSPLTPLGDKRRQRIPGWQPTPTPGFSGRQLERHTKEEQ
ncbi:class I SAM-dependent methyltransferase [Shewanella algae]|uniref:Type 11 methyltransferase n=1 Tax=Shewanella algae TaxID=38313 RepID=A0AAD1KDC6_9GAMM|nr:class I SAM-dependent methyltransferase [Shewanella algae]MBO2595184.1 methyltransferase domain-containing protein [Shewanella algae]MBO2645457.1 methyltransferase domain-containing protein [Shewanella algae]MBO2662381.1 methyltransferase domain-containing protein [Shewanella algae]MBO2666538.1 methyltransferase domain-containing protein [Shewanella algae]MCL1052309.1 class I SAM-dependent methyltransferase [Shewanella algae]